MRNGAMWVAASVGLASGLLAVSAEAALTQRFTTSGNGGMRMIGSTLGADCGSDDLRPGATVGCVLEVATRSDPALDLYFVDGTATAGNSASSARTSATLALPAGATVQHARLYWGARRADISPDGTVTLARAGSGTLAATADAHWTVGAPAGTDILYQATANVTAFVAANGNGLYSITGVDGVSLAGRTMDVAYSGWSLVVIYALPSEPFGTRTIFDGLDSLFGTTVTTSIPVRVSNSVRTAHLGLFAYGGSADLNGDSVRWNTTVLANGMNPASNFFNSTRTHLGAAASGSNDEPAFPGTPDSVHGIDLDVVDISALVRPGDTTATLALSGGTDRIYSGVAVTEFNGCNDDDDCTGNLVCRRSTGDCVALPPDGGADAGDAGASDAGASDASATEDAGDAGDAGPIADAGDPTDGGITVPDSGTPRPRDASADGYGGGETPDAASEDELTAAGGGCDCHAGGPEPRMSFATLLVAVGALVVRVRRRKR